MAIPVTNQSVFSYTVESDVAGQRCMNVYHYQLTASTGALADYVALAADLDAANRAANRIVPLTAALMSSNNSITRTRVQSVYPTRLVVQEFSPGAVDGTQAGSPMPPNVSAVIEKTTDYASRWGRGSAHIAGVPIGEDSGGIWGGGFMASMVSLGAAIKLQLTTTGAAATWTPILYHAATAAKPDKPATTTRITPITECYALDTVRVMRRRTVRVGI